MSKELIVHTSPHETRLAILEDDQLVELHVEGESQHALAGSIYKGRVTRVLPGMQSAFVNIGLERDAFLYVSDFFDESDEEFDQVPVAPTKAGEVKSAKASRPDATVPGDVATEQAGSSQENGSTQDSGSTREKRTEADGSGSGRRERRGRRSRRRRGKGSSGFPTTKYADVRAENQPTGTSAPDEQTTGVADVAEVAEVADVAGEAGEALEASVQDIAAESDFAVLPGESLAKYAGGVSDSISGSSEEDAPSRDLQEAVGLETLMDSNISALAAVDAREQSSDEREAATSASGNEVQDVADEPGDTAQPSEQDLAADSVTAAAALELREESPSSPDSEPDSQAAEQPVAEAEAEAESEETDRAENNHAENIPAENIPVENILAENISGDQEVVEAPATASETEAEANDVSPENDVAMDDDAAPEDDGPEPQATERSLEEEASENIAATAPDEADEPPQALESDDEHHGFPGYPGPPAADSDEGQGADGDESFDALNGNGDAAAQDSGDFQPSEDATEADESAANNDSLGEARVRGDAGSSSFVHRRGRRGRRRSQRQRDEPEKRSARVAAPLAESERSDRDSDRKINDMLAKGQEVLVQIAKEPLGKKGARITSHIALPGRFLVYMPTVDHIGVSRKIPSDKERVRLRKIVQTHRTGMPGGFIVRTAGEGVSEEDVRGDMLFLYNQWLDIRDRSDGSPAPALLHHDDDVVERVLRDRVGEDFKTIWVDGESEYERILRFVERFQPDLLKGVKLYTRGKPMFDQFNITAELAKAMRPKVWLKSGGYIVINQTEALVAIDVNTGKYVGKSDRLEDTIVNTNLEAVKEIVRQLRIRDLGGIIVVDFIDMEDRSNRQQVLAAIENDLRADMAPSKVLPFNEFGLVAITRKRVKQSLERALCTPCPYCHGSATVKSVQTVIQDILGEARKMATSKEPTKDITLRVNQEVARKLKSRDNNYVQEIEQIMRGHVLVRSDVSLHREHFDIG